jgi:hypothetical protein
MKDFASWLKARVNVIIMAKSLYEKKTGVNNVVSEK